MGSLIRRFDQTGDAVDEASGGFDGGCGAFQRHHGVRPRFVIGHALQVVGFGQKAPQFLINTRIVLRQLHRLGMQALVGFDYLSRAV